jgi:hypothetical protein
MTDHRARRGVVMMMAMMVAKRHWRIIADLDGRRQRGAEPQISSISETGSGSSRNLRFRSHLNTPDKPQPQITQIAQIGKSPKTRFHQIQVTVCAICGFQAVLHPEICGSAQPPKHVPNQIERDPKHHR